MDQQSSGVGLHLHFRETPLHGLDVDDGLAELPALLHVADDVVEARNAEDPA